MKAKPEDNLQINKRTVEIKTTNYPDFKGTHLSDVYGNYSRAKEDALYWCYGVEQDLKACGCKILESGITSYNTFQFTYCIVFEYANLNYVRIETATHTKTYLLED